MKRNRLFSIDKLKEYKYSFLKSPVLQMNGSSYEVPFATKPTKGSHSLESCEGCREQRLIIIEEVNEKFENFPNCCDSHRNLNNKDFFNKNDFNGIAEIFADKVMYSYHHIINNLDSEDWYSDITAYLNYTVESFGEMPSNCGEPFQLSNFYVCLLNLLRSIEKKVSSEKISLIEVRTRINKVKKLIDIDNKPLEERNVTDLNLLLSKYDEWFKAFPFDLPYFKHLEQRFKKLLPLHTGRTRYNKYLDTTEHEPHTKESLTVSLLQTTQNILTNINGATLYEKGLLSNPEKIAIDLVIQNRKLELLELSAMPNTNKADYIKVLKKWIKQEKKFIKEITPILKTLTPSRAKSTQNKSELNDIENLQNNLTTKVSIKDVYNHFVALTTETNRNNEFYLTVNQLNKFIISTFIDLTPIKQRFNCTGFKKNKVRKIFYNFYFNNKNKETNQTGIKRKYFDIMNNAFYGFNENDYTDFAK